MGKKRNNTGKREMRKPVVVKDNGMCTIAQTESCLQKEEIKEAILLALREYDKEKSLPSTGNAADSKEQGFWSNLWLIICMPFARRKTINGSETMRMVAAIVLSLIFSVLRWLALVFALIAVWTAVTLFLHETVGFLLILKAIVLVVIAFISYLFSGVFRRVSVEVDNIKDENILFAFFAAVGTWISIIVVLALN